MKLPRVRLAMTPSSLPVPYLFPSTMVWDIPLGHQDGSTSPSWLYETHQSLVTQDALAFLSPEELCSYFPGMPAGDGHFPPALGCDTPARRRVLLASHLQ
ncbi:ragulator complex protein LAMTOR1 [Platysternon megacephalum]|uniref:Ragulator complex protein LAMTOR1 n=1 Tax=Platysternon megacephalum TaxID=55544 RepID=A0A4D9E8F1_9SAUR|nr:ragulator complex protein LAMTOR1 [Platysternon megacephalum]